MARRRDSGMAPSSRPGPDTRGATARSRAVAPRGGSGGEGSRLATTAVDHVAVLLGQPAPDAVGLADLEGVRRRTGCARGRRRRWPWRPSRGPRGPGRARRRDGRTGSGPRPGRSPAAASPRSRRWGRGAGIRQPWWFSLKRCRGCSTEMTLQTDSWVGQVVQLNYFRRVRPSQVAERSRCTHNGGVTGNPEAMAPLRGQRSHRGRGGPADGRGTRHPAHLGPPLRGRPVRAPARGAPPLHPRGPGPARAHAPAGDRRDPARRGGPGGSRGRLSTMPCSRP